MCGPVRSATCATIVYLIDTSAWVLHFSRSHSFDLRNLCPVEERVLCLPVYQEILQGIGDEGAFRAVQAALDSAPMVEDPLDRDTVAHAVSLYRIARKQGFTIRSSVDCLISACAIRHDLTVIHNDRDFPAIARVSELKEHGVA